MADKSDIVTITRRTVRQLLAVDIDSALAVSNET
jgi:hypothetical protein